MSRGTEILTSWDAEQRLYVKGDVGIEPEALAMLESWLGKNALNWTVLLLEDARGETYRNRDGRNYSGAKAVEYALGQGLQNQGEFAKQQDKRTGQANGAILAILLKERTFFYSGSETQNRRGLGQRNWRGDLDRPAFRAMSNGRRLIDAVKGTVEEVNSRLTRRLQAEQKEREREMREAQQRIDQAGRVVGELEGEIDTLEKEVAAFKLAHPKATGDLTEPRLPLLRDGLKAARAALEGNAPAEALKLARPVGEFVDAQRRSLANYPSASAEFAALNEEIGKIIPGREGWGSDRLELAREELAKAEVAHALADSSYQTHLESSSEALRSAREELRRAADALRAEMERDEQRQREREAARARARKTAMLAMAGAVLALAGFGYFLNRRRRSFKEASEKLIANWDSGFDDKTDQLFALLDRTTVVVGTEIELPKRGYTGETLRLSKQTIEDVDQLFIMSSTVSRLLAEAREQVYPKYGFQRVYNWFGSSRYRSAMSKLRDEMITFRPEDGVELLIREEMQGKVKKPETLLGNLESCQPFALSFPNLMEEFNRRAARATGALDVIEESWASISNELETVREKLNAAGEFESEIAMESVSDQLFRLENVFTKLIPSAQDDLDRAVKQGGTDPVGALADPLPDARRKSEEAAELCSLVKETRESRFPAMLERMRKLEDGGHGTAWVGYFLKQLSEGAEALATLGVGQGISVEIGQLAIDFEKLEVRCDRATELAARLAGTAGKEIGAVRDAAQKAREEIGVGLELSPEAVLRERGLDPDVLLREAEELRAAASLAIDRGGVDAAEAALDEVARLMKEGLDLVAISRSSFDGHLAEVEKRDRETQSLAAEIGRHTGILDSLKSNYEESALELSAGDPSHPTPGVSVTDHIVKVEHNLQEARERLGESQEAYREARLIEAASLLAHISDLQHRVGGLFGEIREREERIEKMEQANGEMLRKLDGEVASMQPTVAGHRTMRPTVNTFEAAELELDSARRRTETSPGDPFKAGAMLESVESKLERVRSMAQSDRELFDELSRSLQEAASHLAKAKQVSHHAVVDRIPDSRRTGELQEVIEKLIGRHASCEQWLMEPHGDWVSLDREADEIAAYAARSTAEMRGELKKAQAAVAAISSAAGSVREAAGWIGSFGVRIPGSPGANRLHHGRNALMSGDYLTAHRYADDAGRSARQAVAAARNEEDRKRRAAARAAAAARRRSFSSSSSSSSGSSFSFGGGSSSFGGGSSSSGMGSSGFSSGGGSGMGSSGW